MREYLRLRLAFLSSTRPPAILSNQVSIVTPAICCSTNTPPPKINGKQPSLPQP